MTDRILKEKIENLHFDYFQCHWERIILSLKSGDPARTHSGIVLDQDFNWKIHLNNTLHLFTHYRYSSKKKLFTFIQTLL